MNTYTLIKNGITEYQIVRGACASPSEITAANELQKYLKEISGVQLTIVIDTEAETAKEIVVGETNRENAGDFDRTEMGKEGFVIRTRDSKLWIVGGKQRGTLYGIYYFLENYLNCRFFTEEIERIPKTDTITLDAMIDDKQKPFFAFRDVACQAFNPPHISAKRNFNVAFWDRSVPEEWGELIHYAKDAGGHTFGEMIPGDKYFDTHPEYFAMDENGERVPHDLCLSNPEVIQLLIANARKWLSEDPKAEAIHLSQNDIVCPCMCENCKKIYEEEGGAFSGTLLRAVNAVADNIKDDYPDVLVATFAYQYTRSAPAKTKPADNVRITFCTIEGCFSHPHEMGHEIRKRTSRLDGTITSMMDDLRGWAKVCKHVSIWDYVFNAFHAIMTFPDFEAIRQNLRLYADLGIDAVQLEGWCWEVAEFIELRTYLLSKLLYNPYMSKEEYYGHMEDFLTGVYGPGGHYLRQYIDLAEEMTEDICFNLDFDAYHFYPMPTVTRHERGMLPDNLTISMVKDYKNTEWKEFWNWYEDVEENRVSKEGMVLFEKAAAETVTDSQKDKLDLITTQVRYIKSYYYHKKLHAGKDSFAELIAAFIGANDSSFDTEEKEQLPNTIRDYVFEQLEKEYFAYNEALMNTYIAHDMTYFRPAWEIAYFGPYHFDRVPGEWGTGNAKKINL